MSPRGSHIPLQGRCCCGQICKGRWRKRLTQGFDHVGEAAMTQNSPQWDRSRRKQLPPSWQEGDAVAAASASACSPEPAPVLLPPMCHCCEKHHRASAKAPCPGSSAGSASFPGHCVVPVLGSAIRGSTALLAEYPAKESCKFSTRHPPRNRFDWKRPLRPLSAACHALSCRAWRVCSTMCLPETCSWWWGAKASLVCSATELPRTCTSFSK